MEFEAIKKIISMMMDNHYSDFVKALISIEKGITDQGILDVVYEQFMENDNLHLLDQEFENIISECIRNREQMNDDTES